MPQVPAWRFQQAAPSRPPWRGRQGTQGASKAAPSRPAWCRAVPKDTALSDDDSRAYLPRSL